MLKQVINDEKFTNIQKAQAGLTRIFKDAKKTGSFYRVMKNDEPLGVLIPNGIWQSLIEDLEALSSPVFRLRVLRARQEKKSISAKNLKKQLNL